MALDTNWQELYREVRGKNLDAFHAVVETCSALGQNEKLSEKQTAAVELAMMKLMKAFIKP